MKESECKCTKAQIIVKRRVDLVGRGKKGFTKGRVGERIPNDVIIMLLGG